MICPECGKLPTAGALYCECGHDRLANIDFETCSHKEMAAAVGLGAPETVKPAPNKAPEVSWQTPEWKFPE